MGYWGGNNRNAGGRNQHSSGGNKGTEKNQPWYEVIRTDRSAQERPVWNLTCYGHVREGQNDVVGDISPEEVRYANMVSAEQGTSLQGLKDEFRAAERARVELFQGLSRGKQAPSQVGRPVQGNMGCVRNLGWVVDAGGGGVGGSGVGGSGVGGSGVGGAWGQQQGTGFGGGGGGGGGFGRAFGPGGAAAGFGQSQQPSPAATGGFGTAAGTGFGGGFGGGGFGQPQPTGGGGFGQASSFGQQQQQPQAAGGFGQASGSGQQQQQQQQQPQATGGFGQASGFGQQQQQPTGGGGFGQASGFGQQQQAAFGGGFGAQQQPQPELPPLSEEEARAWGGPAFDKVGIGLDRRARLLLLLLFARPGNSHSLCSLSGCNTDGATSKTGVCVRYTFT